MFTESLARRTLSGLVHGRIVEVDRSATNTVLLTIEPNRNWTGFTAGQYTQLSVEIDGVRVVTLEKLVELKLASGMTAPDRLKDLADVQELIKARDLGPDFAEELNPYVREQFLKLWEAVEQAAPDAGE